jgi:hypothetical protein
LDGLNRAGIIFFIPGAVLGAYRREGLIMSAFLVSAVHIDSLVRFGAKHRGSVYFPSEMMISPDSRLQFDDNRWLFGRMLYEGNVAGVNARYGDDADMIWYQWPTNTMFLEGLEDISPVQALKACDCYEYQASEWPEYEGSAPQRIIDALRKYAIGELPGYDDAQWEIRAFSPRSAISEAIAAHSPF